MKRKNKQNQKEGGPKDIFASEVFELYQSYIQAGFTTEQSFQLVYLIMARIDGNFVFYSKK
jgi:hypothetical protein